MRSEGKITRENALILIKQFAKAYRKVLGKTFGEIIIVGGGSIMLNYKFRDATQDFDVILRTVSGIQDVIARFADENDLPRDWMNSDFVKTASFSPVLSEVSRHLCTLNNGTLEIRTVTGVYLIAMKLRAHREYRNDISDAIGIYIEERDQGKCIVFQDIQEAYKKLYREQIPEEIAAKMQSFCEMKPECLKEYYEKHVNTEKEINERIVCYVDEGMNISTRNVEEVIARIKEKMDP